MGFVEKMFFVGQKKMSGMSKGNMRSLSSS
jgi:hypothetical protein